MQEHVKRHLCDLLGHRLACFQFGPGSSLRPLQRNETAHVVEDDEFGVWLLRPNEKDLCLSTRLIWLHQR
jgi:hypothetical protein